MKNDALEGRTISLGRFLQGKLEKAEKGRGGSAPFGGKYAARAFIPGRYGTGAFIVDEGRESAESITGRAEPAICIQREIGGENRRQTPENANMKAIPLIFALQGV